MGRKKGQMFASWCAFSQNRFSRLLEFATNWQPSVVCSLHKTSFWKMTQISVDERLEKLVECGLNHQAKFDEQRINHGCR